MLTRCPISIGSCYCTTNHDNGRIIATATTHKVQPQPTPTTYEHSRHNDSGGDRSNNTHIIVTFIVIAIVVDLDIGALHLIRYMHSHEPADLICSHTVVRVLGLQRLTSCLLACIMDRGCGLREWIFPAMVGLSGFGGLFALGC